MNINKPILKRKRRRSSTITRGKELWHTSSVDVRFSDVDSMRVMWHGKYIQLLEDGREAWGKHYGLTYLDVHQQGFFIPIVNVNCDYKQPLTYGDTAIIKTCFVAQTSAKLYFEYEIYRAKDEQLVASASTLQVFMNSKQELQIATPAFFEAWREKWEI
ncbi:MAG: acyl-CoA thioesterase [Saprospiraceae bacterium]|nr:acyl-CoA thioesterase [Saprospiraceae bacterium]